MMYVPYYYTTIKILFRRRHALKGEMKSGFRSFTLNLDSLRRPGPGSDARRQVT
jgi:hypothetical protein